MIVGTAGHIDHGKSSLVRALTGIDPDRLKEEKQRGITIDLGYAYWPRPGGGIIGFVDVPGHEALIHNMLAGATGIDFVLLVVAADDGAMPQTREHLAILDLLGLKRGIVALSKCDLASPQRLSEVTAEIRTLLSGTGLRGADVLPVSTVTGEGLDLLTLALDEACKDIGERSSRGRFRLEIDRCFSLAGAGTVVTGTAASGMVRVGDRLTVSPSGLEARVRSIHAQNRQAQEGRAGERCALALAGPNISKEAVARGQSLVDPTLHAPTRRIDVSLTLLASERKPLGAWQPVRFHHGARELGARIVHLREKPFAPGETGLVQLVLDGPIAAAANDRFIIRDWNATRTIGGGVIHDLRAPERKRRTPERLAELAALGHKDAGIALEAFLGAARGWCDLDAFFRDRAIDAATAETLTTNLELVRLGSAAMLPKRWQAYRAASLDALDTYHRDHPDIPGLGSEHLRLGLSPRLPAPVFSTVLARLVAEGEIKLDRAWVSRVGHVVKLSPEEETVWASIRPLLNGEARFSPPRVRDIARSTGTPESFVRRLFKLAARRGDVDEVAHDHFFLRSATGELASIARDLASGEREKFNVIAFRDRIGAGRKVAIHILEYFDRQGFTMRRGDWRRINPHKANLL
jgi:selenocysteine-specific elongation factor